MGTQRASSMHWRQGGVNSGNRKSQVQMYEQRRPCGKHQVVL